MKTSIILTVLAAVMASQAFGAPASSIKSSQAQAPLKKRCLGMHCQGAWSPQFGLGFGGLGHHFGGFYPGFYKRSLETAENPNLHKRSFPAVNTHSRLSPNFNAGIMSGASGYYGF